ncbi:Outer membrane usher protein HtrE precursor, partial [Haemophilus influenzae]
HLVARRISAKKCEQKRL